MSNKSQLGISRAEITFFICQTICILFFGLFTEYGKGTSPLSDAAANEEAQETMHNKYPMFQDIHIMIFIGFGFLMVFLKNNSWTSIGFNYLIAAWAIQICILFTGFWHNIVKYYKDPDHEWEKIELDIEKLILADFGAAAVLISFGAVLGKCSIFQLWVMATFEVFFYCLNESIIMVVFQAADIGGSMVIHTFGAFFGLSVALFYQAKDAIKDKNQIGVSNYLSDLVSMIGTLFLFAYWPSFNAGLGTSATQQQRTVINTYLSIACSVVASIIVSKIAYGGKLQMEIILNASLAGGVAIGSSADIIVLPFGAMICGFISGVVSSLGFAYLSKFLQRTINLHDTCGVLNLHGMPGIIGGITSAIVASRGQENFGVNYASIFPAGKDGRQDSPQAGFQMASLGISLGISIVTGLFTGFITSRQWFQPPPVDCLFDDRFHYHHCVIEHETLKELEHQIVGDSSGNKYKTGVNDENEQKRYDDDE